MHEPVLVLNANFEPINVCTTRRAVGLLLAGKADMVMNGLRSHKNCKAIDPAALDHSVGDADPPSEAARQVDAS